MAVTALKVGGQRIKFITTGSEIIKSKDGTTEKTFLTVDLRVCDEDFIPLRQGNVSIHDEDEETYHKKLRIAALEKGHFVPEESTDHQWHPNYNPEDHILEQPKEDGDTI